MDFNKLVVTETPDRWVLVQVPGEGTPRVLAMYGGSYLSGSSWKLNSGIVDVVRKRDRYLVAGESGSVYQLYKKNQGLIPIGSDPIVVYDLTVIDDGESYLRYFEKKS